MHRPCIGVTSIFYAATRSVDTTPFTSEQREAEPGMLCAKMADRLSTPPNPAHSLAGPAFSPPPKTFLGQKALATGAPAGAPAAAPAAEPPATAGAGTAAGDVAAVAPVVALAVARAPQASPTSAAAAAPARVVRLTTEALEVWSVAANGEDGSGGTESLEVSQPLAGQFQRALGVAKVCLVDVAVVGAGATRANPGPGGGEGGGESPPPVMSWGLDLLVLAVAAAGGEEGGAGGFSLHAVRVSSEEASWVGSSVAVKVGVCVGPFWQLLVAVAVAPRPRLFLFALARSRGSTFR